MSDLAAHAPRAGAQSKALKKAEGGGGQIYVRCGVARLPICPGDTRSGKCAARPCRLQSTCAGVHGPVRASPPRPPRAVLENTNSLIRTVPYVERTADRLRSGYGMNRAAGAGRPVRPYTENTGASPSSRGERGFPIANATSKTQNILHCCPVSF
jgi:hypothetical protein